MITEPPTASSPGIIQTQNKNVIKTMEIIRCRFRKTGDDQPRQGEESRERQLFLKRSGSHVPVLLNAGASEIPKKQKIQNQRGKTALRRRVDVAAVHVSPPAI